ncbi:histidine phosphatase family protein [Pseudorhodoferax sp. Leaf267]|uniref:histidine phosphatase family protein n=1 Tax=Pseudorhodoferax sp. Leaf267 TaxID=1736316 RepID=UPI0009EBC462|nr:histidine phosphatase family protein [Pseudorhodoferax sp. Leaf267]
MTRLILVRHGETDWNRQLRFQGQVDIPLNATGHEQAQRVGRRLALGQVDRVISSDLSRARQTAEPLAELLARRGAPDPLEMALLREQSFGEVDGLSVDEIKQRHPAAWNQWINFQADYAFKGGESTRGFQSRVLQGLRELVESHAGQTLVVVTHGGVLDMVWRASHALPLDGPRQSHIPNGGVNQVQVVVDADVHRLDIVGWADIAHLDGMPPQPVYDQARLAEIRRPVLIDGR